MQSLHAYHSMASSGLDQLYGFCEVVDTTPSLDILRAVDTTVDTLVKYQRNWSGSAKVAYGILENIKTLDLTESIDASGFCVDVLEKAEMVLSLAFKTMKSKRKAAVVDPQLFGHNEESVIDEYSRALDALQDLHDCMRDLRWAILEHNASVSEERKTFKDADSLIESLAS